MIIGKMDKRLEVFRPVLTEDGYGGQVTEYESAGKVWAELKYTNYAEQQAQGTPMNREQLRFSLRPRRDIQRGWQLDFNGGRYTVETADNTFRDSTILIVRRYEQGV